MAQTTLSPRAQENARLEVEIKATPNSRHSLPVAPSLLDRQFAVSVPNRAWVTDITYIATEEGWLYLAGIKDLFNGELVGYPHPRVVLSTRRPARPGDRIRFVLQKSALAGRRRPF